MRKQKIYQVDAFTSRVFQGNPAAVCILDSWLPDSLMQDIAMENNLSETAFLVKNEAHYEIRWFTPSVEVDLCGHATLASAFVLFTTLEKNATRISFDSPKSGELFVTRDGDEALRLNFPGDTMRPIDAIPGLNEAMGKTPIASLKGKTDIMLIYETQREIESLDPNFFLIKEQDVRGVIATAPGDEVDFVSRFFAPQSGVDEDPVTGSAHTSLAPYWAGVLGKNELSAKQLSKRGGLLKCQLDGDRVHISGHAVLYMEGEIYF